MAIISLAGRNQPIDKPTGPDFLCIGMQKAGTGFLFDALSLIEGFRLPLRKKYITSIISAVLEIVA